MHYKLASFITRTMQSLPCQTCIIPDPDHEIAPLPNLHHYQPGPCRRSVVKLVSFTRLWKRSLAKLASFPTRTMQALLCKTFMIPNPDEAVSPLTHLHLTQPGECSRSLAKLSSFPTRTMPSVPCKTCIMHKDHANTPLPNLHHSQP